MLFFGTTTFADPLRGYEILNQFQAGGKWNTLSYPSIKNSEFSYYVAWWSPMQWVFPFVIMKFFHVESIQVLQFFLISGCLIVALIGYFKLFRMLGFSLNITLASLICVVTNQLFYWQTFMYYGGDLFFIAFLPYYILFILKIKQNQSLKNLLLLFVFSLIGMFIKNTFLFVLISSFFFLFLSVDKKSILARLKYNIPYFIVFVIVYLIVSKFHLSLGETPGTAKDFEGYSGVKNDLIGDLTYSLGSPIGIFSRFSFFIQKVYFLISTNSYFSNFSQIIPFFLTILFLIKFPKKHSETYYHLLVYLCIPFLSLFSFLYFQDKAVSYEMRHFSAVSFLFFPGLISWLAILRLRTFLISLLIGINFMDLSLFFLSLKKIEATHSYWNTLKLPNEDVELLTEIEKWDKLSKNGLLIAEDYWQLSIGVKKNDKIIVRKKEARYEIVSGMELDYADEISLNESFLKKYNSILLVASNLKPNGIVEIEKYRNFKKVKKTNRFTIYELVKKNNYLNIKK